MTEDEIEIEKLYRIVDIVERIPEFILAKLKSVNNTKKLKNEIR